VRALARKLINAQEAEVLRAARSRAVRDMVDDFPAG
jgi:hypothetical protein